MTVIIICSISLIDLIPSAILSMVLDLYHKPYAARDTCVFFLMSVFVSVTTR